MLDPERGIQGLEELGSRREGSQTLGVELLQSRATFWRRWIRRFSGQEGPSGPEMLKGEEAYVRCPWTSMEGSKLLWKEIMGREVEVETSKWR